MYSSRSARRWRRTAVHSTSPARSPGRSSDAAAAEAPRQRRGSALSRLLPLLRLLLPYRSRVALAFVAIALSAGMVLVIGQGLKRVIDGGFSAGAAGGVHPNPPPPPGVVAPLRAPPRARRLHRLPIGAPLP